MWMQLYTKSTPPWWLHSNQKQCEFISIICVSNVCSYSNICILSFAWIFRFANMYIFNMSMECVIHIYAQIKFQMQQKEESKCPMNRCTFQSNWNAKMTIWNVRKGSLSFRIYASIIMWPLCAIACRTFHWHRILFLAGIPGMNWCL